MSNPESDDEEDAEERYFFHDEWEEEEEAQANEEDDDSEIHDMGPSSPAQEVEIDLDMDMVNWYARSHERYIKHIIHDEPVEDYGLSIIPPVAAAAAEANNNNNEVEAQRVENDFRCSLDTGPILVDSPFGEGVCCELKSSVVILHHQSNLPHWQHYTDALKECRIQRLFKEFSIQKIHLHRSVSSSIFAALHEKHLRKLSLSETNIGSAGFVSLTEFVRSNTTLERLVLDKNTIDDNVDMEQFSKALRMHPQLEYLSLCDCDLGWNLNALSDVLHAGMKQVCLGGNKIESRGGFIIASYLSSNPRMDSINIERNELDDNDVAHFANSLRTNTRLKQLTLSANKFSLVGVKSIFKEIFNPATLNNVADCNHTCALHLFTKFFNPIQRINSEVPEVNKQNKILLALRMADSQLHYFEDVSLELMPFVLQKIQREEVLKNALTRVFQCTKGWIVPHMHVSSTQKKRARSKRKRGSV